MARDTHPRRWWAISLLLALLLTGCDGLAPAGGPVPTPLPTVIPVAWDERAAVTLIRADAFVQPLSTEDAAARVPQCAVFGDDRVRWVEPPAADAPLADAPGRVYESPIDGAQLDQLARSIADSGFFALDPVYGPDLGPVHELTIRLEGQRLVGLARIEDIEDRGLLEKLVLGLRSNLVESAGKQVKAARLPDPDVRCPLAQPSW